MMQTPAHKQTDPNKKPGQVVYPIKQKLSFEEWWKVNGGGGVYLYETSKYVWYEAQENK